MRTIDQPALSPAVPEALWQTIDRGATMARCSTAGVYQLLLTLA
jgi:hypothetical protein